jgi:hypothetical protein
MAIIARNLFFGPRQRIVTNGLVLYFDPENSASYTPSVGRNYHPNPTDIFAWSGSGANAATLSRDTISSPVGNKPLRMVTFGNDAHIVTYNSSIWNISDAVVGQTWTVSVWAKANIATTGQIFIFESTDSGSYLSAPAKTISITTDWQRFDYTVTFGNTSTTKIQVRLDGADSFVGARTIWWDGLQVELNSAVTGFSTSIPTNPTYITDLTPSARIGTVNVTGFVRNSFDFDGINDKIDLASFGTTIQNNFSVDFWCIPRTTHGIDAESTSGVNGVFGQRYLMGAELISVGSGFGISAGTNGISVYEHSGDYLPPLLVYSSTIPSTSYSHVVVTYTNKQPRLYLNGVLVRTGLQSLRPFVALGGARIGWDAYGNFNGLIGMVKYYNRTLTLAEIQQNFDAHKTRFGI